MRFGHTLVVRLANSAADFKDTYCAAESFPLAVFEKPQWPLDQPLELDSSNAFAKVLKPADAAAGGGKFHVSKDFRVVVTSTFKPDAFERLLGESLPLSHLQPMQVCDRVSGAVQLSGAHQTMKGRTAEGDAIGSDDRTSLLAERRQAEEEERENALAKVKV